MSYTTPPYLADGSSWSADQFNLYVRDNIAALAELSKSVSAKRIQSTRLAVDAASVAFSSIPQVYSSLQLLINARGSAAVASVEVRAVFNSDAGANYDYSRASWTKAASATLHAEGQTSALLGLIPGASATAGLSGSISTYFPAYRIPADLHRLCLSEGYLQTGITTGLLIPSLSMIHWRSTTPIDSITLSLSSGNFVAGSIFYLYGLQGETL